MRSLAQWQTWRQLCLPITERCVQTSLLHRFRSCMKREREEPLRVMLALQAHDHVTSHLRLNLLGHFIEGTDLFKIPVY